jgi:DNA polymerase-4
MRPGGPTPVVRSGVGILHVDMDAFFAAVEVLDDPSLEGRALIVGGDGARGVVASCSYEARRWGVRSAMPSLRARRLCPEAVFRPARHDRYSEVSAQIHDVFGRFTPLVEGISLDEAFLDVRGGARVLGSASHIADAVRAAILADVGLHCSVGIAATKFVAKLASRAAKPSADRSGIRPGRGVVTVGIGEELDFLRPLAIDALWGVGPATSARLRALGITTVGQLAEAPVAALERSVGRAAGRHLHDLALGIDPRPVEPERDTKSIGHEETYAKDRHDRDGLHRELVRMADAVGTRLRRAGVTGRTVQLKVRFPDFTTVTRARTLAVPMASGPAIEAVAGALLDALDLGRGVRLLGVSVSSLAPAAAAPAEQLRLRLAAAGPAGSATAPSAGVCSGGAAGRVEPERWEAASLAIDAVRTRYGPAAVGPAVLLGGDGLRIGRSGDNRWEPVAEADGAAGRGSAEA